jgi:hypothetical protein
VYIGVIMAEKITWLEAIPLDAREELVHDLTSNENVNLVPLEINNSVYWIPIEVNMLIRALEDNRINELGTEDEGVA